jgi:glycosyltransferase involved in cell wall biosynthesis
MMPQLGLWVEGLVSHISDLCEIRIIAPVPYCPPLPKFLGYSHFRRIPSRERVNGIEVMHPRFFTGPGYSLHSAEASLYYWGIRGQVKQFRRQFPFDLIHAHFTYPDGVVAVRLSQHYRVPVLITEHAPWQSWLEKYPRVRRQAIWASRASEFHLPVSCYVRNTIVHFAGESKKLVVIPVGVNDSVFVTLPDGRMPDPNKILYVGRLHSIKGVDILFKALGQLINRLPELHLVLVGGGFLYRNYRIQEEKLRRLALELGLERHVEFVGFKSLPEVAEFMRTSSLLVLPSRAESFGAVLVEALACGTPVVATRCGGPEDIVTKEVGVLVPKEDVDALANGIEVVLARRETYDPTRLRSYALQNFSWENIARQLVDLYSKAIESWESE